MKNIQKPQDKNKVVYKIKFIDCKATYVGETGITAKQRMGEHRKAVEKREEKKLYLQALPGNQRTMVQFRTRTSHSHGNIGTF